MSNHGVSKYTNEGCRCTVCRTMWAESVNRRKLRRKAWVAQNGLPESVQHGYGAYSNWGCRCEVCTDANRVKALAKSRAKRGES